MLYAHDSASRDDAKWRGNGSGILMDAYAAPTIASMDSLLYAYGSGALTISGACGAVATTATSMFATAKDVENANWRGKGSGFLVAGAEAAHTIASMDSLYAYDRVSVEHYDVLRTSGGSLPESSAAYTLPAGYGRDAECCGPVDMRSATAEALVGLNEDLHQEIEHVRRQVHVVIEDVAEMATKVDCLPAMANAMRRVEGMVEYMFHVQARKSLESARPISLEKLLALAECLGFVISV